METVMSVASLIIKRQFGYILSYRKNLQSLETKVRRLEGTIESVLFRIDEAQRNAETIEELVKVWLKRSQDTAVEANRLIEGHEEAGCCMGLLPNLFTRSKVSERCEEMTQMISQLLQEGTLDRISYHVPFEFDRGYEVMDSISSMLNDIKEALKDPKIYMIGVHGMGGVGKTILLRELAWQVRKDVSFVAVAIAVIGCLPNVAKIQDEIAEALGLKLQRTTEAGRAAELRQRIKHEESLLIILDDIWSELDLTQLGIPSVDTHNVCKLVMISRNLNVLKRMGTQKEFYVKPLPEVESWNLFQKMAGDVVTEFNIEPIAEKMAKCCAGLPLLIVSVAKSLRGKDVIAWRMALIQLERLDYEELLDKVYPTLELSYIYLKSENLKSLFLIIGSFGLNEISTEDLFSYCWGLGFYGDIDTLTYARNKHYMLIDELRASSLLLQSKPEWVRMHDVVLGFAKRIASRFHRTYAFQRFSEMNEWSKLYHLQERPDLKLLLLENTGDNDLNIPDNFFFGMTEVRTLSLCRMSFTPYPPPSLRVLINLHTLNLYGCKLGDITMVAELKYLEMLCLEKSSIQELPKEIGHLIHLRLLNLADCSKLRFIPANLISSLSRLEELYMRNCNIEWEVEGSKSESNNASLSELQNLHELTTLDISLLDSSVWPRDFQFPTKLERCNVLLGNMWKWSLEGGDHKRVLLNFANLKGVKDVYQLNDGFHDGLLSIINSTEMSTSYSASPSLETSVLCNLNNIEEICRRPLPTHSFQTLESIKVEGCDRLEILFLSSLVPNLFQLHELEISNCKDMNKIIAIQKQEDEEELPIIILPELHCLRLKGLPLLMSFCLPLTFGAGNLSIQSIPLALFNQQVVMPKLETLELYLINAHKIWDDKPEVVSHFQNLTCLKVHGCHSLTSLFPSEVGRALVKLQHLEISLCSMLREIFVQEEEVQFPNLETFDISDMSKLESIWPSQVVLNSFCKLKQISMRKCERLGYVFPISVAKKLWQLQDLEVNQCAIKNIVEESDTSDVTHVYLEKLRVIECHNMKTILPSSVLFHTLDKLSVSSCYGVVNIITPSTSTTCLPKLRILKVSECQQLEEIYGSGNESDAPLAMSEIAFMKLEEMTLSNLPKLTSFCQGSYDFKFPSLQMVELRECPMMQTFCHGNLTTPSYTKVQYV